MKKIIAYAQDFVSFLIENYENLSLIDEIILFGSVAREDNDKNSDVDIFVNTKHDKIENQLNDITEKFYSSIKYKKYWNLHGINNRISLKVGNLEEWNLKRSIISNGIVLYGKYHGVPDTKKYTLFIVKMKGKRKDQIKIWRKLYGYSQKINKKTYRHTGLIESYSGKKLAHGVFIVPLSHSQEMINFLKKSKTTSAIIDMWSDASI